MVPIQSYYPVAILPHLRTPRACPPKNIRQKEQFYCWHHCPEDPERSSERFSHKSKRSFRWRTFSSPPGTHLQGSQTDSDKTREAAMSDQDRIFKIHKPVIISHHRLFVLRNRSELWKECFIGDVLMKITLILPSCCSPQERSLRVWGSDVRSEWGLQDKQDCHEVTSASV